MSDWASDRRPHDGAARRAPRSPQLFNALRAFCLGAFYELGLELEQGAEIPVALEEHAGPNRPTLYEYRPLVGSFVEERAGRLAQREDARDALAALKDEPAAGIFASAHADERRPAPASTGRTRRSSAPTSSSSARSTATAGPTRPWRHSSGSPPAGRSSSPAACGSVRPPQAS